MCSVFETSGQNPHYEQCRGSGADFSLFWLRISLNKAYDPYHFDSDPDPGKKDSVQGKLKTLI